MTGLNKKGFTLIELLATLIILTIIALITFPIVNKLLADQDKSTFKNSVEGLVRTIETDRADYSFSNILKYVYYNGTLKLTEQNYYLLPDPRDVSHNGRIEGGNGTFYIDANGDVYGAIYNGVYCAHKEVKKDIVITEGTCPSINDLARTVKIGNKDVKIVTYGDGLYKDEYNDNTYRYKGVNPNNYVAISDHLFRIISADDQGIKIIDIDSDLYEVFDVGGVQNSNCNYSNCPRNGSGDTYCKITSGMYYGCNAFASVPGGDYVNGTKIGTVEKDSNAFKVLENNYQYKEVIKFMCIWNSFWNIGAIPDGTGNIDNIIQSERASNFTNWFGLITPSDFILAKLPSGASDCYNNPWSSDSRCNVDNWLYYDGEWTMSPIINNTSGLIQVGGEALLRTNASEYGGIRPVIFLENASEFNGSGTYTDPFVLFIDIRL